jgi:hypothetical protein
MVTDISAPGSVRAPSAGRPPARVPEILLASITALAAAGEIETACRLAGEARAALRGADPDAARRFDAFLHRLTPELTW